MSPSLREYSTVLVFEVSSSFKSSAMRNWMVCQSALSACQHLESVRNSLRVAFLIFYHEGCGLLCLSVPRMQRRFRFVPKPRLVGFLFGSKSISLPDSPRAFSPFATTVSRFCPLAQAGNSWAAVSSHHSSSTPGVHSGSSRNKEDILSASLSYIFVHQGLTLYSVGPPSCSPERLCKPCWFFQA